MILMMCQIMSGVQWMMLEIVVKILKNETKGGADFLKMAMKKRHQKVNKA